MAFREPLSLKGLTGRSSEQISEDGRRLDVLAGMLPQELLAERVEKFLASTPDEDLKEALGMPILLDELLGKAAAKGEGARQRLATLQDGVKDQLKEAVSRLGGKPAPAELVQEEIEIAKEELVRHWVDLVLTAVEIVDRPQLKLNAALVPELPPGDKHTWEKMLEERNATLLPSVALRRKDITDIMKAFATTVRHHLVTTGKQLELPDGVNIYFSGQDIYIRCSVRQRGNKPRNQTESGVTDISGRKS